MLKPIGSFSPNRYGLYDVVGNVWEWVDYDKKETGLSPTGLDDSSKRLLCGGGWDSSQRDLRLSARDKRGADFMGSNIGFRCAQSVEDE
jgi:formylglycine-generating enzyme required for sulfatase activity